MKTIIKLEELFMMILGIFLFSQLEYTWWWFLVLILLPDIGMFGYALGDKVGAHIYNVFHHKGLGILLYLIGVFLAYPILQLIGVILFSHASMDRIFGYGLKYDKGFKFTHLGKIGKGDE